MFCLLQIAVSHLLIICFIIVIRCDWDGEVTLRIRLWSTLWNMKLVFLDRISSFYSVRIQWQCLHKLCWLRLPLPRQLLWVFNNQRCVSYIFIISIGCDLSLLYWMCSGCSLLPLVAVLYAAQILVEAASLQSWGMIVTLNCMWINRCLEL